MLRIFFIAIYLLSCSWHQEKSPCSKYSNHTKQYCLMQQAHQIGYPEIIDYCGQLGEWEAECRYEWMKKNKRKYRKSALLSLCQNASDCLFEVIEYYPEKSLQDQLNYCSKIPLNHYKEDCQRFALKRTFSKGFDREDVATFSNLYSQKPRLMAVDNFAGVLQECTELFTCVPECKRSAQQIKKRGCPKKRKSKPWVWSINNSDPVQHHD
jgi:hypothetical protein